MNVFVRIAACFVCNFAREVLNARKSVLKHNHTHMYASHMFAPFVVFVPILFGCSFVAIGLVHGTVIGILH